MNIINNNEAEKYLQSLEDSQESLTDDDMNTLYQLASSSSSFIRSRIPVFLVESDDRYTEKSVATLLKLTFDEDELVRVEAADSMCIAKTQDAFDRLFDLAKNDEEYLVRGYSVMSMYDIHVNMFGESFEKFKHLMNTLLKLYKNESDEWVLVYYYEVFYKCGDKTYLQKLIDSMASSNPDVRVVTVQTFIDILSQENESIIRETIAHYYKTETMGFAKDKMDILLEFIDNYDWE